MHNIQHEFTMPLRKDKGGHRGANINWKSSQKAVALLKKSNTLKLQWSLYHISLNLAARVPPVSHSGLSCNTGN